MTTKDYCNRILNLIGKDDLKTAIQELYQLLKNSPKLDEAILQSARYNDIIKQIRLGMVSFEEANLVKNKIRFGILNLLEEIEEQALRHELLRSEIEKHLSSIGITIQDSKNVVTGSNLKAGGNINIGDST